MLGWFGDVEAHFVVKGTLIKVPVLGLRMRKRNCVSIHRGKSVNDKLVRRGGFGDFFSEGGIKHIDMQVGEKDLQGIILGGIYWVFAGECVGGAHGSARGMVPFQVIVLEEHLPVSLSA